MHILGIPVKIHWSWIFLPVLVTWSAKTSEEFFLYLYVSFVIGIMVLLHELAHCVAAIYFGHKPKDITLFALGGMARIPTLIAQSPKEEVLISVAGPGFNFIFALLILTMHFVLSYFGIINIENQYIAVLWICNFVMGLFNMAPIFPMDGGRVLRGTLSMFFGNLYATKLATAISFVLCFAAGLFAIATFDIMLLFIAIFISLAAYAERKMVQDGEIV